MPNSSKKGPAARQHSLLRRKAEDRKNARPRNPTRIPANPTTPEPLSQADAKAFERGQNMAMDFIGGYEPGELKSALLGFLSACRSRLNEQIAKHDTLSALATEALDVVEER